MPRDPRAEKNTVTSDPERIELYDLAKDPGELADVSATKADLVEQMRGPVASLRSRFRANGWRW
jgi:hypothetical protein